MGYANGITVSKRFYFRNRLNRYLDDPETIFSPIDDITQGCPQWREVDELRATKRNWFVMYGEISQYVWLVSPDEAYQEDVIPAHSDIRRKHILYWDLIPLWKLCSQYTPQERIFNSEAKSCLLTINRLVSSGWLTIFNLANPSGGEMSSRQLMILMDGVMINFRQHQRN
jgi:hypothetical protein